MNLFIFLTLIFSILIGDLKEKILLIWRNPVSRAGLLLFALLSLSISWSSEGLFGALDTLKKYNELWYIALILPIFNSDFRRNLGINTYLFSMSIVLVGVYLVYFELMLPIEWTIKGHKQSFTLDGGFASHIITNILMAFAMFIAAHKSVFSKFFYRIPYIVFFIFSSYYVLLISTGTSGQLLAISLLLLFIVQHTKILSILLIPFLLASIFVLGYVTEDNSLKFAVKKMQDHYHYIANTDNEGNYDTAGLGSRPQLYLQSLKLIDNDPWIGTGVGSYSKALMRKNPKFAKATGFKDNPHNEFILIGVQLGLIGLIFLFYLFYTQASYSEKIKNKERRYIAQGLVTLIIIGCMGNSMILDSREGHFWAFFSALLFSKLDK